MQLDQLIVVASTIIVLVLGTILAFYLTEDYKRRKERSYLFWSLGLWVFAFTVFLEVLFALNVYTTLLIDLYLFLVVILVEFLALGSIQLVKSWFIKELYYLFTIIVTIATLYSIAISNVGNLMVGYVVAGLPPILVIYTSSAATFVGALIIVVIALRGYFQTRNKKLLSIVAGVIIVSIAGTLYIASFPAFLYYSEFFGILLLWFGFFDFKFR